MQLSKKELLLYREKIRNNPILFFTRMLNVKQLWEGERKILEAIVKYKKLAIPSGHALGKDFIGGGLPLWWLSAYQPSKVVMTAPCSDKDTEILTSKGWYKFPDLPRNVKVATLEKGNLVFRKPKDYFEFEFDGYLIGAKSKRLEFLVTPNHRCYVRKNWRKEFAVELAEKICGKNRCFSQEVNWQGKDCGFSLKQLELFGFWFGDGQVRCGGEHRRCDVAFTQTKYVEYIRQLLIDNKETFSEYCKGRRYDFVIYSKKKAEFYTRNFKKGKEKVIPQWLKSATPLQIKAFLKGFFMADGSLANGDWKKSDRIRIYGGKRQADDTYELIIKSGRVANMSFRPRSGKVFYSNGKKIQATQDEYDIRVAPEYKQRAWTRRKFWYKEKYKGKVYSVSVPSGIILIRRNGKYHWTGNSIRQVDSIMWAELRGHYARGDGKALIGGDLQARRLILDKNDWFCIAFTTKETQDQMGKFQGIHSPNLMVIVSEAQAIDDAIYEQIEGIITSDNSRVVLLGNPLRNTGYFAKAIRGKEYHTLTLNCLDNPNYKEKREVIPGLASYSWCEYIKGKYGEDSPYYQARVLGILPDKTIDTVIPYSLCLRARDGRKNYPSLIDRRRIISIDPASFGDDECVIYCIEEGHIIDSEIYTKRATTETAGRAMVMRKKHNASAIAVDSIGEGRGIADMLTEAQENVIEVKGSFEAVDKDDFLNLRAQMWFYGKKELENGRASLPDDETLIEELSEPKYFINSKGKYQLEEKDDIKTRLGRSPNRAEAYLIGLWALQQIQGERGESPYHSYHCVGIGGGI